ncbi:MAG: FtsX-like permease family protein [Chlorobiales bacterium]|nr:FtsX-like permease family protein [Chlorobiales bacterium]
MNIFTLVYKNILARRLSIFLTTSSVALGVALIAATIAIKNEVETNFRQSSVGYEMIVGAKGSPMQLVLSTVYMLGNPVGNIRYEVYEVLKKDRRVALALPYAFGDNYAGHRIVGTTDDVFTKFQYVPGKSYEIKEGRTFKDSSLSEAVIGSEVAKRTGLKIGDKFTATHGLQESSAEVENQHETTPFTVVGIMKSTGATADKIIYTTVNSVWEIHNHHGEEDHEAHHEEHSTAEVSHSYDEHDSHAEEPVHTEVADITAVIVKVRSPLFALQFYKQINDGTLAQAAIPVNEIKSLFDIVGNVDWAFLLITMLVIVVALIGMLVAIYNSLNERRREIAIMRSLGAHRRKIFGIITLEAAIISFFGTLTGILLSKLLLLVVKGYIAQTTGVEIGVKVLNFIPVKEELSVPVEVILITIVPLIGALAGALPAISAYRTDVARNLNPVS